MTIKMVVSNQFKAPKATMTSVTLVPESVKFAGISATILVPNELLDNKFSAGSVVFMEFVGSDTFVDTGVGH